MIEDKKQLEQLVEDLADGKDIDWVSSKQSITVNEGLLEQLISIAKISKAYGFHSGNNDSEQGSQQENRLFDWGHLQVLEKIGEGSYGEVFKAYDSVLDREVALKLLKEDKVAPIQSRAFIQEARRLAKVRNRHVLAIHGANVYNSRVGMWSDLILGVNLAEKQRIEKPKSCQYTSYEIVQVAADMADALIAVHDAGLIHGDIKPSNVMQESNKFILMDFGAGMEFTEKNSQSGYIIGTLLYMAPELFEKNDLSHASDIYALGVLLFNLATSEYPVNGKNMAEIKQAHMDRAYVSLENKRQDIPRKLRQLIQQLMAVDPKERPTAIQIKASLNWIITAPQRRNKQKLMLLIVGLSVLGTLVSSVGFYRAHQAQEIAVLEKEKAETVSEFMQDTFKAPASLGKGKEVRVADLLATAGQEATEKFANQPHYKAVIFNAIGDSYNSLKLPEYALNYLSESLLIQREIYGSKTPETLNTLLEVAESQHVLGNDSEAKKLYLEAVDIAESAGDSPMLIFAQIKLADLIHIEGDYIKAETMLNKIISQIPAANNHENFNKFLALVALAQNHLRLSKYQLSEATGKQALQWLKQYHPNDDIHRNQVLNIIARALIWQRKVDEAEVISRELVALVQLLYGRENYEYLRANTLLSTTLFEQGKLIEALKVQEQMLALTNLVQGDNKLYTVIISTNLANTKVKLNDKTGAEQLMRDALQIAYGFLDEDSVHILSLELNLTGLLNIMHRYDEAEVLAQKTLNKIQQKLGNEHVYALLILDELAVSLAGQQRVDEAEKLHLKVIRESAKTNDGETSQMITVLGHYVNTLIHSEQFNKAKTNLSELLPLQQRILGESHPDTIKSRQMLEDLLIKTK